MLLIKRKIASFCILAAIFTFSNGIVPYLVILFVLVCLVLKVSNARDAKGRSVTSSDRQYHEPIGPGKTPEEDKVFSFMRDYEVKIDRFFEEHPSVIRWRGHSLDSIDIHVKRENRFIWHRGGFTVSEDGELETFVERTGPFGTGRFTRFRRKAPVDIPKEMLVSQISGLLKDNEDVAKYCDQVAATLLDEGRCVFNVPVGLHLTDDEYKELYYNEDWEEAWLDALKSEFQVKEVEMPSEKTGCFKLMAA